MNYQRKTKLQNFMFTITCGCFGDLENWLWLLRWTIYICNHYLVNSSKIFPIHASYYFILLFLFCFVCFFCFFLFSFSFFIVISCHHIKASLHLIACSSATTTIYCFVIVLIAANRRKSWLPIYSFALILGRTNQITEKMETSNHLVKKIILVAAIMRSREPCLKFLLWSSWLTQTLIPRRNNIIQM